MVGPNPTTSATQPNRLQEFKILQLTTSESVLAHQLQLSNILRECVNEGSSIGFFAPLPLKQAIQYWNEVSGLVSKENHHLFILTAPSAPLSPYIPVQILGTIQVLTIPKVTHSHRAEIAKLLVLPSARRQGIARRLMEYVEEFALGTGREVLTLDTATESAAREMYRSLGWEEWGTCRDYASWPDGRRCDATFFRKGIVKGRDAKAIRRSLGEAMEEVGNSAETGLQPVISKEI